MKTLKKLQVKYLLFFVLPVFSFLMGCMLMINIVPINKTCRIDSTDREFNIMKNSKLQTPKLIILIMSAPTNFENRTTIRNTWLKLRNRTNTIIRHYFVTCSVGIKIDDILLLSAEQSQFSDLLILPTYDGYDNLTRKVIKSFIWLLDQLELGLDFRYVLKCDDDSFVRIDNLPIEIEQIEGKYMKTNLNTINFNEKSPYVSVNAQVNNKNLALPLLQIYWGYFNGHAQVKMSGKWKEDNWILCDRYLPYALGGGYILSKGLVVYLARNAKHLRYYNSEDVSVGMWLSSVNNILRIHDRRFDTEWISRGCQNSHLVSHHLSKAQMHNLYNNIIKNGKLCTSESSRRDSYLYDWSSAPSKCCGRT